MKKWLTLLLAVLLMVLYAQLECMQDDRLEAAYQLLH